MALELFPGAVLGAMFTETAVVKAIPAGGDDTARTVVIAALDCTAPQALDDEDKERAGMATNARIMRVHCDVPDTAAITSRHRFVAGGIDYRIRGVTAVPATNPAYLELLLEDEGVAGD